MAQIDAKYWSNVKSMYEDELLSAQEIAVRLNVTLDAVYYCLRHTHVRRRSAQTNNGLRFAKQALSYKPKKKLTTQEQRLKDAGILLYWCEGYKQDSAQGLDFANSDPEMMRVFLRFLREICAVNETRLRAYVYCHEEERVTTLEHFWQDVTQIPAKQFTKTYVARPKDTSLPHRMSHGLLHVRYSDKKLLALMLSWIKDYTREFCVGTQVVNGGAL